MAKNYNTQTGTGRRIYETIKFVCTAILIAVLMVTISQTKVMATSLWDYWTKTDKGYMWTLNIIIAVIVGSWMFGRRKGKTIAALKLLVMFCVAIISECLLWHHSDIWGIIVSQMTMNNLILAGGGIVAATIAFVLHIKDIDYSEPEPEYEPERPKQPKHPQSSQQHPQSRQEKNIPQREE